MSIATPVLELPALHPRVSQDDWLHRPDEPGGRDRRIHERLPARDLDWLKSVRLKFGAPLKLLDLSAGGALVESTTPLRPGSSAILTITGRGIAESASFRVLRCEVARVNGGVVYRGACAFERMIALPGPATADDAATTQRPTMAVPRGGASLVARVHEPEDELAQVLGVLRAAADQRPLVDPAIAEAVAPATEGAPAAGPGAAPTAGTGWSRIVVRYLDGRLLKGFSQDFHASRQHFHLSPSIDGVVHRPVLVPMSRLKAVFFVRDFDGRPERQKRQTFDEPLPGRRIEITFLDDEVIVGATLGYRPDGTGFFITPADSTGNNLRVFVIPGAIRHIRYL